MANNHLTNDTSADYHRGLQLLNFYSYVVLPLIRYLLVGIPQCLSPKIYCFHIFPAALCRSGRGVKGGAQLKGCFPSSTNRTTANYTTWATRGAAGIVKCFINPLRRVMYVLKGASGGPPLPLPSLPSHTV